MAKRCYSPCVKILSLDIGLKRTGMAYADDADGIAIALTTIVHSSARELLAAVRLVVRERGIEHIVVGLPLLPSGEEGAQSGSVRSIGHQLSSLALPITYLDERYTTPKQVAFDGDASAAVELLLIWLHQNA